MIHESYKSECHPYGSAPYRDRVLGLVLLEMLRNRRRFLEHPVAQAVQNQRL